MTDSRADQPPRTTFLRDYTPPPFIVATIDLNFDLSEDDAVVTARSAIRRAAGTPVDAPLVLNGHHMELVSVALDGRPLPASEYEAGTETLTIPRVPAEFVLEIKTRLQPQNNTALEGLYRSSGNFCTQCEAQGFRRITYFLDRPDVLARYTTTIYADAARYPVLLSNGNRVASGAVGDGRHWARWEDPFPKPCYLFALVAGDLACIEDEFVTMSGRRVALHLFVQRHNTDQCAHAMRSLKKAMRWDEERYGREYDLNVYMIVAVDDFNMGAMENKGLNVFNSRYVLAKPETATDFDFQAIEAVIAHEYFHNWSGNRVTCRDWFQLSLKEGFTVFRDQQFSAEMNSPAVKRIADVNVLRTHQFREDGGPMAHPVRPDSYVEINNFYTLTVYNKGAELIRMLHCLLGDSGFRRGTDLYFARHDGQAVTTDDFVRALEDANGIDLAQFRLWYEQAGTPVVSVERHYDDTARTFTLSLRQSCPATPGQTEKKPFHIPFAVGLVDEQGNDVPLQLAGESDAGGAIRVLELREAEHRFVFVNVPHAPVPSLLRGFSAPVKVECDLSESERCFQLAHDRDPFNRWDAGQQLAVRIVLRLVERLQAGQTLELDDEYVRAIARLIDDAHTDPAFVACALALPSETYIAEFMTEIDPDAIHRACRFVRAMLAQRLREKLLATYTSLHDTGAYRVDAAAMGRRALKNCCLGFLMELETPEVHALCLDQFRSARNMTDMLAALGCFANVEAPERETVLAEFYGMWRKDPLVLDKWFAVQAGSRRGDTVLAVQQLLLHPDFTLKNPNRARAVIGTFSQGNPARFHDASGAGYQLVGDAIIAMDELNPQVAARLANGFTTWKRYDAARRTLMREQLERIMARATLSKDVYEVVSRSLKNI